MSKNPLGKIFKIEKQLGRGDLFEVSCIFPNGLEQIRNFHHEDCDGLGALLTLSKEWTGASLSLPAFKPALKTGSFLRGVQGVWSDLRPHRTHWKNIAWNAQYTPRHLARRVFSQSSTTAIIAAAKNHKVNLNSLLLWSFNQVVCKLLLADEQRECHWLLPVNTRRLQDIQCISNRTSSVGLHFDRFASMNELALTYKRSLNPWRTLGNEKLTEFLATLSEERLRYFARLRGEKNSWMGSFSNLGVWYFPTIGDEHWWPRYVSIAPPAGTPCFPIGIGIITWQGHMSLSLRLHAALCQHSASLPNDLLELVTQILEQLCPRNTKLFAI